MKTKAVEVPDRFPSSHTINVLVMNAKHVYLGYYEFELPKKAGAGRHDVESFRAFFDLTRQPPHFRSDTRIYLAAALDDLPKSDFRRNNPDHLPLIRAESLWAFYEMIGWDRHGKTYVHPDRNFL